MSRCRSTQSVPPGTTEAASGTRRAATGSAGGVAPSVGAAMPSVAPTIIVNPPRAALIRIAAPSARPRRRCQRKLYRKYGDPWAVRTRSLTTPWPKRTGCAIVVRLALGSGDSAMDNRRTLAVDIGGTGIKVALLDGAGKMIGD